MSIIKSFRGLRPKKEKVAQVASPPYDVLNSEEARTMAEGNPAPAFSPHRSSCSRKPEDQPREFCGFGLERGFVVSP